MSVYGGSSITACQVASRKGRAVPVATTDERVDEGYSLERLAVDDAGFTYARWTRIR